MDRLLGSKKYKSKLTGRLHEQPGAINPLQNITSRKSQDRNLSSQAFKQQISLPIESLDLRGNFFASEDSSSSSAPADNQHEVTAPVVMPLSGIEGRRKSRFGKGAQYNSLPDEATHDNPALSRQSTNHYPPSLTQSASTYSATTIDPRLRQYSDSIYRDRSIKTLSVASNMSGIDPLSPGPLSFATPPKLPPHRVPYNRIATYHYGEKVATPAEETAGNKEITKLPGTTPLSSPRPETEDVRIGEAISTAPTARDLADYYTVEPFPEKETESATDSAVVPLVQKPQNQRPSPWVTSEKYDSWESGDIHVNKLRPSTATSKKSLSSSYRHSILKDHLADLTYSARSTASSMRSGKDSHRTPLFYDNDDAYAALPLHKKALRNSRKWYRNWSTRTKILLLTAATLLCALAIGLALGLYFKDSSYTKGLTPTWRPAQGTTWNIQLNAPITHPPKSVAKVYDIDLFDNNATTIAMLHSMGRRVICYFSAGTYENWRPDAGKFPKSALGNAVSGWANETWLDTRDKTVRSIMQSRIDLAISKGCDGVDPDNVDGYSSNITGFPLTVATGVDYILNLATYAHTKDIAIGLKNAPELVNGTIDLIDWEMNESCAKEGSCGLFQPLIQAGKPVLHIEYSAGANATALLAACTANGTHGFSTLLKRTALDSWSMRCPLGITDGGWGHDSEM